MSTTQKETFEVNGETFFVNPDLTEFLGDAGFSKSYVNRIKTAFKKADITSPEILLTMRKQELENIKGISENAAESIYAHAMRLRRRGAVLLDYDEMKEREGQFSYLPSGSSFLDRMLTYSNGAVGLRSRTLIELYGKPGTGKTQLCMTAAALCMRPVEDGGWGKGVVYIDSEGAFEGYRFEYLARYWGVDKEFIEKHLLYSRVDSFDDVEHAVNTVFSRAQEINLGMVIVDSIMDPLKTQYFVGGKDLSNLQPRQQHLKKVLDKLKALANMYNAIALYTNHVRAEISTGYSSGPDHGPQGGAVMGHASDIRIALDKPNSEQFKEMGFTKKHKNKAKDVGLKFGRAKVVDSGFLPESVGFFLIGPMGTADPANFAEVYKHAEKIQEEGYLCIDSKGNNHPPYEDFEKRSSDYIVENKEKLYGI